MTTKLKCDHTVHLRDENGNDVGSWIEQRKGQQLRIVCGCCGKFYGYVIQPNQRKRQLQK